MSSTDVPEVRLGAKIIVGLFRDSAASALTNVILLRQQRAIQEQSCHKFVSLQYWRVFGGVCPGFAPCLEFEGNCGFDNLH